jgi:PAS domain S-box-containing protein
MPGHKANQALQQEPAGSNEDTLRQRCAQLEQQLKACTAELTTAYDRLREETHQRQQLDATLGTSEARYRTLFEESRQAIFMNTRAGEILEANQALLDLFGYTRDEMQGLSVLEIYAHPEERGHVTQEVERAGSVRDFAVQFRKKDGTVLDCLLSATVRRAADGSILGYQGIIQDVTERQRAERELADYRHTLEQQVEARAQELQAKNAELEETLRQLHTMQDQVIAQEKLASLGALTAGIAHEIRNPLNFVTNFAELSHELLHELHDDLAEQQALFDPETFEDIADLLASLQQNVQKITEHGKRADRIVNGMLQHSRGQAGVRQPTDINLLLSEDIDLAYHGMRAQDTSFNVSIDTLLDPTVGSANVVTQDISRVFLNILNNALYAVHDKHKALGEGFRPTLSVRSTNLGDRLEVRIRDNGNGIPPAIRDKLFQPFFTTKPTGSGTGLGLSISRDIVVQEHQGTIEIDSEVGQYTEFIITFPRQTI